MKRVKEYIEEKIGKTVCNVKSDEGTYIGLPYPFTTPTPNTGVGFREMYYWDTYFANLGLIASGDIEQAKNNTGNFNYLVKRFGYIPNGSRTFYLSRSQPPYFAFAVSDLENQYSESELKEFYHSIKTEYEWWQKNRNTELGLNRYGDNGVSREEYEEYAKAAQKRTDGAFKGDNVKTGKNFLAIAESGWDCSPRFNTHLGEYGCMNGLPVDLNANLYFYEVYLNRLQKRLRITGDEDYLARSENRKQLINCYLWNREKSVYLDYDTKAGKNYSVVSCAAFQPYFVKMADDDMKDGLLNAYKALIKDFGVSATDKDYGKYQWSYPNGWPPLQYIAFVSLKNYGFYNEAKTVAEKYVGLCNSVYEKTGCLWEKYNVAEGNVNVTNEYAMPEMFGWTAGVYLYFLNVLEKNGKNNL